MAVRLSLSILADQGADLSGIDPFTFWGWCRANTLGTSVRTIMQGGLAGDPPWLRIASIDDSLEARVKGSVDWVRRSVGGAIPNETWRFVAVRFDSSRPSDHLHLLTGGLRSPVAEPAYQQSLDGTAALPTSGFAFVSVVVFESAKPVSFAHVGFANRWLTNGELLALQYRPTATPAGTLRAWHLLTPSRLQDSAGTATVLSLFFGNAPSQVDHVPVCAAEEPARPFVFRRLARSVLGKFSRSNPLLTMDAGIPPVVGGRFESSSSVVQGQFGATALAEGNFSGRPVVDAGDLGGKP